MSCITTTTITAVGAAVAGIITAIAGWVRARAEKQRANAEVIKAEAMYEAVVTKLGLRRPDRYFPSDFIGRVGASGYGFGFGDQRTDEQLINEWLKEAK
jgi:hypothetical protein